MSCERDPKGTAASASPGPSANRLLRQDQAAEPTAEEQRGRSQLRWVFRLRPEQLVFPSLRLALPAADSRFRRLVSGPARFARSAPRKAKPLPHRIPLQLREPTAGRREQEGMAIRKWTSMNSRGAVTLGSKSRTSSARRERNAHNPRKITRMLRFGALRTRTHAAVSHPACFAGRGKRGRKELCERIS